MDHLKHPSKSHASNCAPAYEEALTLYVDGELPFDQQARLFAHLAVCESCRRTLEGVMAFRRVAREENLNLPPAVDEAFLKRLAKHRSATVAPARAPERRPVWRRSAPVSMRTASSVALGVFVIGLLMPLNANTTEKRMLAWVSGEEERVVIEDELPIVEASTVYVFYPGLTVEATKGEVTVGTEAL